MTPTRDVVVIGAGAAGLMAAIAAAESHADTLLLEKNARPGVKILMSGGTRCNITHATDNRGIVEEYGPQGKFLHSPLAAFSVDDALAFFHAEGVPTKVEDTGKVFPVSNRAADVLAALLARLHRSGASFSLEEPLRDLSFTDDSFLLTTNKAQHRARRVILTTGGLSYPGSGTTGDGYAWAAHFGHTIVPTRPALVPITTAAPWVPTLRGVTLPDVVLRILEDGQPLARRRGSLLFAHFGLSGPVALDVSRTVSAHPQPRRLTVEMDVLPDVPERELDERLRLEATGKKQLAVVLAAWLPRRLCDELLLQAGLPLDRKAAALSKPERTRLVAAMKRLCVPVTGTLGYGRAEVTAGGVALEEVDFRTMQSRKQPGLYFAGEILDLDGPIGGYNFQAAWSTGWLAGSRAATSLSR